MADKGVQVFLEVLPKPGAVKTAFDVIRKEMAGSKTGANGVLSEKVMGQMASEEARLALSPRERRYNDILAKQHDDEVKAGAELVKDIQQDDKDRAKQRKERNVAIAGGIAGGLLGGTGGLGKGITALGGGIGGLLGGPIGAAVGAAVGGSILSAAEKANPVAFQRLSLAMEDMAAVAGRVFEPVVETLTGVFQILGDVLATILPDMRDFSRSIREVFTSIRQGMASLGFKTSEGAAFRGAEYKGLEDMGKSLALAAYGAGVGPAEETANNTRKCADFLQAIKDAVQMFGPVDPNGVLQSQQGFV